MKEKYSNGRRLDAIFKIFRNVVETYEILFKAANTLFQYKV
jgi:hypothetical protein